MCCQTNRRRRSSFGMTWQRAGSGSCCCGCGATEAPTATISMADYDPVILVPTSVFDQGDVSCGCDW